MKGDPMRGTPILNSTRQWIDAPRRQSAARQKQEPAPTLWYAPGLRLRYIANAGLGTGTG